MADLLDAGAGQQPDQSFNQGGTESAQSFLDAPSVLDRPDPIEQAERKKGAMDFMRSLRPDLFDRVFGRTDISDDEKMDITRKTLQETAASDPDDLLNFFGMEEKLRKLMRGLQGGGAPAPGAAPANPGTAFGGTQQLAGRGRSIDE